MQPTQKSIARMAEVRAVAARTLFERAGLEIEQLDEHRMQIRGFVYWPATGFWRHPDGRQGRGGAHDLVAAIKATEPPAETSC